MGTNKCKQCNLFSLNLYPGLNIHTHIINCLYLCGFKGDEHASFMYEIQFFFYLQLKLRQVE